jgi:hypothetical protein
MTIYLYLRAQNAQSLISANIDEAKIAADGWEGATTFVYIVTLTGKTIKLPVNLDETIDTIKGRIQNRKGFHLVRSGVQSELHHLMPLSHSIEQTSSI